MPRACACATRASPKTSTGPAPAAELAQPVADRLGGDLARPARGLGELNAAGEAWRRAPRSGCSPSRARRRPDSAARRSAASPTASTSTSAPSSAWPPVTITAPGPSASSASPSSAGRRPLPQAGERPGLGHVRGQHGGPRQHALDQRRLRGRVEQRRRRSRRPSPGRRRPACRSPITGRAPSSTASIVGSSASIPTLTASTPMSEATARTWAMIISGATGAHHLDPDRVLRGDRRDRGRPVDAAARERLQVGLDPGAAAGVRAGDRQAGADALGAHPSAGYSGAIGRPVALAAAERDRRRRSRAAPAGRARPRPPASRARPRRRAGRRSRSRRRPARGRAARPASSGGPAAAPAPCAALASPGARPDPVEQVEHVARVADRGARRRGSGRWCPRRPDPELPGHGADRAPELERPVGRDQRARGLRRLDDHDRPPRARP